jgi:hypothetical protein
MQSTYSTIARTFVSAQADNGTHDRLDWGFFDAYAGLKWFLGGLNPSRYWDTRLMNGFAVVYVCIWCLISFAVPSLICMRVLGIPRLSSFYMARIMSKLQIFWQEYVTLPTIHFST